MGDNIPILTEAEKFNETVLSSVKRVQAHLLGIPHPIVQPMRPLWLWKNKSGGLDHYLHSV